VNNRVDAKTTPTKNLIWLLLDDRAGNRSQCLGVADALGLPYQIRELTYGLRGKLPNMLLGASFAGLTSENASLLTPPWPDLVIAAGRRTASVARQIKHLSDGKTRIVQVMWPGGRGSDAFDLIAVPNHDNETPRANTIQITGAPHGITPEFLGSEKARGLASIAHLPEPRIALIVGGSTKNRIFTPGMGVKLGTMASNLAQSANGSLLVTTSRRTGDAADALIKSISAPAQIHRWGDHGENPYTTYLASADAIIVTGDSMSMCSEACSGTGPVYIYAPDPLITPKHKRLHEELIGLGYARRFDGTFEAWQHKPLNAANDVAAAIHKLFQAGVT